MNRSYLSELLNIVLLAVILYLLFTRGCGKGNDGVVISDTLTSVHYIHDTAWYELPQKVIHTPAEIIYRDVPANVDTAEILNDFFASNYYEENYGDSNIAITICDTIKENAIAWRDVKYQNLKPTAIITNQIMQAPLAQSKAKLYAGFNIGGNKNEFSSFTPELELIMYDKRAFSVGYNLQNKSVEMGVKWKISLRK